jgi:hypothetical protein
LKATYVDKLKHVSTGRAIEDNPNSEPGPDLIKVPHPNSDSSHVDPGVYDEPEKKTIRDAIKALQALQGLASLDGELDRTAKQALAPLERAKELLDADSKGMKRLKLIFEWTLCQVTTLFGEINASLDNPKSAQGKTDYSRARDRYIELLKDLDDREPETGGRGKPIPGERGYGHSIKWAYILPIIHGGRIKGAKVVAKWNPHISSSGIAIPHK